MYVRPLVAGSSATDLRTTDSHRSKDRHGPQIDTNQRIDTSHRLTRICGFASGVAEELMSERSPRDLPIVADEASHSSASMGDLTPEALRAQLHRIADWIADYRATIEQRRIVPNVRPGEIAARLSVDPPEAPTPLNDIVAELDTVVMPGIVHWGHPAFLGYFGST